MQKNIKVDRRRKSSFKVVIAILLTFLLLLIISESLYRSKNDNNLSIRYYLKMTEVNAKRGNLPKALESFNNATNIKVQEGGREYKLLNEEVSIPTPVTPYSDNSKSDYLEYFETYNFKGLNSSYLSSWAIPFYQLGKISYEYGEFDNAVSLWESARMLAPEWSYFHVELANLYLTLGDSEKARAQIEYCLKFHFPQNHCREFLEGNIRSNSPEQVGTWEEKINEI